MITKKQLFFNYKSGWPKKVGLLAFVIILMCTNSLLAQQKMVITGEVTSSSEGTLLPGINVLVKGTKKDVENKSTPKELKEANKKVPAKKDDKEKK
mgnify:CR=1 FL=1